MYELIIAEKPNASAMVAEALADGKPLKENFKGVPFYRVTHKGKDIVVGCAVGHLFGLAEKDKKPGSNILFLILNGFLLMRSAKRLVLQKSISWP